MAKTLTIKEKILAFLKAKDIKKVEFFEKTGIQSSNFKGANLTSAPGSEMLVKILTIYPELSAEWLLTGEGEMLKTNRISRHNSVEQVPVVEYKDSEIPQVKQIPELQNNHTRPRIPLNAAAGGLSVALSSVSESECEQMPVIPSLPKYDFTIVARGESMEPVIESGDELACRFITESAFIQWGRIHVLDTAQGIVVKRIVESDGHILCRSDNKGYPDFPISKEEIYHMALVVGLLRHF